MRAVGLPWLGFLNNFKKMDLWCIGWSFKLITVQVKLSLDLEAG